MPETRNNKHLVLELKPAGVPAFLHVETTSSILPIGAFFYITFGGQVTRLCYGLIPTYVEIVSK